MFIFFIKIDIYDRYRHNAEKNGKKFVDSRLSNNNEENYLGQQKNNVFNQNLVMPSEYVRFTYPRLYSQYNEFYLARESELSLQLTRLDTYDEFGK
jgi:hypothetical protein